MVVLRYRAVLRTARRRIAAREREVVEQVHSWDEPSYLPPET